MKKLIFLMLVISLVLSNCQSTPTPAVTPPPAATPTPVVKAQIVFPAGFLRTDGQKLVNTDSGKPVRLQAVNFTHDPAPQDYADARALGFNAVRLRLDMAKYPTAETAFTWLDNQIKSAREAGTYLIINLDKPYDQSTFWSEPAQQQSVVDFWGSLAKKYSGEVC